MVEPDDPRLPIPRGALFETAMGDRARHSFVADNDDTLPLPAGEPLAVPARLAARRQSGTIAAIVLSCAFHACVALFFLTRASDAVLLAGSDNAGITILGDAPDDQASAGDLSQLEPATQVTLISTLEAKPVEAVDAVAVTEADSAEIVEPVPADAAMVETIEPVEATATRAEAAQPVAEDPAPVAVAEPLSEILAAETLQPDAIDAVAATMPEPTVAETIEPAEAAKVEATEKVVAAADPELVSKSQPKTAENPQQAASERRAN